MTTSTNNIKSASEIVDGIASILANASANGNDDRRDPATVLANEAFDFIYGRGFDHPNKAAALEAGRVAIANVAETFDGEGDFSALVSAAAYNAIDASLTDPEVQKSSVLIEEARSTKWTIGAGVEQPLEVRLADALEAANARILALEIQLGK